MVTMGLFKAFQRRFNSVGYIKPVGQQYELINGEKIDKDAVLFHETYGLQDSMSAMSPIAVPSGFTHDYIMNPDRQSLVDKVTRGFNTIQNNHDFVLCEGTGHAGVGSVLDMSNADVAKLIKTKVVLVSIGGIGRVIDEIALNKSCFDLKNVQVLGVIINKIRSDKYDKVTPIVSRGFERLGIPVLGAIPFVDTLTFPTIEEVVETCDAKVVAGKNYLTNSVEKYLIGAMHAKEAMSYLAKNTLLIVPADRENLINAALGQGSIPGNQNYTLSGIVFSGGIMPSSEICSRLEAANIPAMVSKDDSFTIATKLSHMLVKVRHNESGKIKIIQELVETHVDVDRICQLL